MNDYFFVDEEYGSSEDLKNITMEDYRSCKVGFRDKYLYGIVKEINDNKFDLNKIYNMNSEESLNYLMSFKGIGNKVASCILLFAYQKFDVYPVDTWVKKFTLNTYNEYSGLAIQYMFNYKRNKN